MGELPEWYQVIRAARALHIAPWELAHRPRVWVQWALAAESAEAMAQENLRQGK